MRQKGFTLIELIVVTLIIGILTAIAVPQYLKSVETSKADDAVAMMKMAGNANRMFYMDNNASWLASAAAVGTSCNSATACPSATANDPCNIISCKYMMPQAWNTKPYNLFLNNGGTAGTTCGTLTGLASANYVSCVARTTTGTGAAKVSPYSTWGYVMDVNGIITAVNSAPTPTGL